MRSFTVATPHALVRFLLILALVCCPPTFAAISNSSTDRIGDGGIVANVAHSFNEAVTKFAASFILQFFAHHDYSAGSQNSPLWFLDSPPTADPETPLLNTSSSSKSVSRTLSLHGPPDRLQCFRGGGLVGKSHSDDDGAKMKCIIDAAVGGPSSSLQDDSYRLKGWVGTSQQFLIRRTSNDGNVSHEEVSANINVLTNSWRYSAYGVCKKVANENIEFKLSKSQYVYYTCSPTSSSNCHTRTHKRFYLRAGQKKKCAWWAIGGDPCRRTIKHCWILETRYKWFAQTAKCYLFDNIEKIVADLSAMVNNASTGDSSPPLLWHPSQLQQSVPCESTFGSTSTSGYSYNQAKLILEQKKATATSSKHDELYIDGASGMFPQTQLTFLSPRISSHSSRRTHAAFQIPAQQWSWVLQQLVAVQTRGELWSSCVVVYDGNTGLTIAAAGSQKRNMFSDATPSSASSLCVRGLLATLMVNTYNDSVIAAEELLKVQSSFSDSFGLQTALQLFEKNTTAQELLLNRTSSGASGLMMPLQSVDASLMVSLRRLNLSSDSIMEMLQKKVAAKKTQASTFQAPSQSLQHNLTEMLQHIEIDSTALDDNIKMLWVAKSATPSESFSASGENSQSRSTSVSSKENTASRSLAVEHTASPTTAARQMTTRTKTPSPSASLLKIRALSVPPTPLTNHSGNSTQNLTTTEPSEESKNSTSWRLLDAEITQGVATGGATVAIASSFLSPTAAGYASRLQSMQKLISCGNLEEKDDADDVVVPTIVELVVVFPSGSNARRTALSAFLASVWLVAIPSIILLVGWKGAHVDCKACRQKSTSGGKEDAEGEKFQCNGVSCLKFAGIFYSCSIGYFSPNILGASISVLTASRSPSASAASGDAASLFAATASVLIVAVTLLPLFFVVNNVKRYVCFETINLLNTCSKQDGSLESGGNMMAQNSRSSSLSSPMPSSSSSSTSSSSSSSSSSLSSSSSSSGEESEQRTKKKKGPQTQNHSALKPFLECFRSLIDATDPARIAPPLLRARSDAKGAQQDHRCSRFVAFYFLEEVCVSCTLAAISGSKMSLPGCQTASTVSCVLAFLHLLYLMRFRPYLSKVEGGFMYGAAALQAVLSILAVVYLYSAETASPSKRNKALEGIELLSLAQAVLFFGQLPVLGIIRWVRWQKRSILELMRTNAEAFPGEEPLLRVVAREEAEEGEEMRSRKHHNPLEEVQEADEQ